MDISNPIGDQITDAITLAIQVLQSQVAVLERAKARLGGTTLASGEEEPPKARRGRAKADGQKRPKLEDQTILDYFKQEPTSVATMAAHFNVTLTYAHKRVKELAKSLKRVKEGTKVIYMVKPRRNAKAEKTSSSKTEKSSKNSSKAASAAN